MHFCSAHEDSPSETRRGGHVWSEVRGNITYLELTAYVLGCSARKSNIWLSGKSPVSLDSCLSPSSFCKTGFQTNALSSQSPVCLPGCSALLHHLSPAPRRAPQAAREAGAHHCHRDVLGAASQLLEAPVHKAATCTSQNQGVSQEGRQKAPVSLQEVAEVPRRTHHYFALCTAPAKNWTQCKSP